MIVWDIRRNYYGYEIKQRIIKRKDDDGEYESKVSGRGWVAWNSGYRYSPIFGKDTIPTFIPGFQGRARTVLDDLKWYLDLDA